MNGRIQGEVTRVFLTRGFGFVAGDDGVDYFLHADALLFEWERVRSGMRVEFRPARDGRKQNGWRAQEVSAC